MGRRTWEWILVTALMGEGLAWGQVPAPMPNGDNPGDSLMTVQEDGKPPQRCRVIRSWRQPNGMMAYEVKVLATGETMTLVGGDQGNRPGATPANVRQWPMPRVPAEGGITLVSAEEPPLAGGAASSAPMVDWRQSWGKADDHVTSSMMPLQSSAGVPAPVPENVPYSTVSQKVSSEYGSVPGVEAENGAAPSQPTGLISRLKGLLHRSGSEACVSKNPTEYGTVITPEQTPAIQAVDWDPAHMTRAQLVLIFEKSSFPSQREWAVEYLTPAGTKIDQALFEMVARRAQEDPAGTVRAACVRCLARVGGNEVGFASLLRSLHADADPRVREAVAAAESSIAAANPRPVYAAGYEAAR